MKPTVDPMFDKEIPLKMKGKINIDYMAIPSVRTISRSRRPKMYTTFENVCTVVCNFFDMPFSRVYKRDRRMDVSKVRNIIGYMARRHTTLYLWEIGIRLDRDHSNISYNVKVCKDLIETDASFHCDIIEINHLIEAVKT